MARSGKKRDQAQLVTAVIKIATALERAKARHAGDLSLSSTQGQILALLESSGAEGLRAGEIARLLGLTRPTISDALAALERKRLVERFTDASDRRGTIVRATGAGRRHARRYAGWTAALLAALETLAAAEQGILLRASLKLIRELQQRDLIPVARMCVGCRFFRPFLHPRSQRPHHCAFLDAPLADGELRADCADHESAGRREASHQWRVLLSRSG